ncbi:NmrA-like family protein [Flavobacterium sp. ACN2]|jgi:putative NADH-flavin reductase|uniref:NAD(P)-dependent oxidoreductase n=1 Tax=unclassified Flavobacterium TaxID=196869 RepID=UPI000BB2F0FF|nr:MULTISPECIES: NAD(P)H-binding protein [unclassified Flavobacterium]MDY0990358.1 NAD(P)H-binding protein [Flavobacterium sp. CFBP9031]PBI92609.1 NmrA-like family protein [Flavobacterium sp. ACN2]
MKNISKVAVLGGGGRTGKYLVQQLLENGFSVKLLLRNPDDFTIQNSKIEIIKGDAINEESINLLLKDCQAVVSTIGQRPGEPMVASQATKNVLNAMKRNGIERYVLLAGLNIDTPFDKKSPKTIMATDWMKTNFPEIQKDRQLTYDLLVDSKIDWTQVRVPLIIFSDESSKIAVNLEDCLGEKISAFDISKFMVKEMIESNYSRQSPFISAI